MTITSFELNWFNCGMCCADEVIHEKIVLYRRKKRIVLKKYNGWKEEVLSTNVIVDKTDIENFFKLLEQLDEKSKWESDYRVDVCDGSEWELKLRYNDNRIKKIQGTVKPPPNAKRLESSILLMLEKARCVETPILFGC